MNKQRLTYNEWKNLLFTGRTPSSLWISDYFCSISRRKLLIKYATRLFDEAELLYSKYTYKQLKKGFSKLSVHWGLVVCLWDARIDWGIRKGCFLSMLTLFEGFFIEHPLGDVCFMWWDSFRPFGRRVANTTESDEIFNILTKILALPVAHCQTAALHGLGHLTHLQKPKLIQNYLTQNHNISPEIRKYALDCIDNKVL